MNGERGNEVMTLYRKSGEAAKRKKVSLAEAMGKLEGKAATADKVVPGDNHTNDSAMVVNHYPGKLEDESVFPGKSETLVQNAPKTVQITPEDDVEQITPGGGLPKELAALIKKTGLSRREFSALIRTPFGAVTGWCKGRGRVSGAAMPVLFLISYDRRLIDALRIMPSGWPHTGEDDPSS
jgi:DNA-binding transcriptional regulator YiaG